MKYRLILSNPETGRKLRIALIGTWCAVGLLTGAWGYLALKNGAAAKASAEAAEDLENRIAAARQSIEQAKSTSKIAVPRGLTIIDAFQAQATRLARSNGCSLAEFQATPQLSGYISRFMKTTPSVDWVQVDVNATLRGAAPNVIETLKGLSDCGVPFEFNNVDLRRSVTQGAAGIQVSCAISLRLITHNDGGKA